MQSLFLTPRKILFITGMVGLFLVVAIKAQIPPEPFGPTPSDRQIEWFHREIMTFFHYNMNTYTNSDLGSGNEDPNLFQPTALDCNQWMKVSRSMGARVAILVAKHHDGFCIWQTDLTTHAINQSSWRDGNGDVVDEFVTACNEWALKPGLYMSPWDLNHPEYGSSGYSAYYADCLSELLRNYGQIWEIWWDGCGSENCDWPRWADTVRSIAPQCAIFGSAGGSRDAESRWVGNESGIAGDPCWATIDMGPLVAEDRGALNTGTLNGDTYRPAEVDVSIRPSWFYHPSEDALVKSFENLKNIYFKSVGHNCVLLLNFTPDKRGLVPQTDSMNAEVLGRWIYGTFLTNLVAGATVTSQHPRGTGFEPANLVDTLEDTYYATPDEFTTDTIVFNLGESKTFDVVMVREVIELGHRITGWSVDYSTNGSSWTAVPGGTDKTSIGYKWMIPLSTPISASYLRLRITAGSACPALNTFGLFKQQSIKPPSSWPTPLPQTAVTPLPVKKPVTKTFTMRVGGLQLTIPQELKNKRIAVDIFDLNGRCIKHFAVNAGESMTQLNTGSLRGGTFIVQCSAGNKMVAQKFLNVR